jgi:Flp pilus assembly protein TadG
MSISAALRRFRRESSGNVAMMFGLGAAAIFAATGAAVDYSRFSNARTLAATAADSAAIAGAKTRGTPAERREAARKVFEANFQASGAIGAPTVRYENIREHGSDIGFRVEAQVEVRAILGAFTGTSRQVVATKSEAKATFEEPTEVVFVLDTTASMAGGPIAQLKAATTGIIDEMARRVAQPDLLKIGVVPFAQYVNVGLANRDKPWLDVRADYQDPSWDNCRDERRALGRNNCRMVSFPAEPARPPGICYNDGRPYSCGGSPGRPARTEEVCDTIYSEPTRVCTREPGRWHRWHGCVGSRNYPLETIDGRYDVRIPGIMDVHCATPIQELTTNTAAVRTMINGLTTSGETYLPAGMIWGWRMLSPGEPLNAGAAGPGGARKFMIFVTDGRNTLSPSYPTHNGRVASTADQLTRETCANIAADRSSDIKLFTIAFEMDGLETKAILQACAARTGGEFYDATNAAALREALGKAMDTIFGVKLTH